MGKVLASYLLTVTLRERDDLEAATQFAAQNRRAIAEAAAGRPLRQPAHHPSSSTTSTSDYSTNSARFSQARCRVIDMSESRAVVLSSTKK